MVPSSRRSSRPSLPCETEILPRELCVEPGVCAYYGWKNVSIGIWVGQAVTSAVSRVLEMSNEMNRNFPQGRSSVVFVLDQLPAPTPDAKEAMKLVYASEGLTCTAVVLEGTGFWASGIRSMTTNLLRSTSSSMLLSVNSSIDEVVGWLPPAHRHHTGVALPVFEFQRALVALREQGAARARSAQTATF